MSKNATQYVPAIEMRMYEVYEGDYLLVVTSDREHAMRIVREAEDLANSMAVIERSFEAKAQEAPVVLARTDNLKNRAVR